MFFFNHSIIKENLRPHWLSWYSWHTINSHWALSLLLCYFHEYLVSWVFPFVLIYLNFWKNTNCRSISFKLSHWFKIHCFGLWRSWILVRLSRKQNCYWFCYLNLSSVWTYENYIFCLHQGQRNPGWHGLINQHSSCTFTE